MPENSKILKYSKDKTYKCPMCFNMLVDVTIFPDKNGIYRCLKCGYNDDFEGLIEQYEIFRNRYKLKATRLTLDDQRKL